MKLTNNSYSHAEYSSPACEIVVVDNGILCESPVYSDPGDAGSDTTIEIISEDF